MMLDPNDPWPCFSAGAAMALRWRPEHVCKAMAGMQFLTAC